MADLQCAARVLVARHGEAECESDQMHDHGDGLTVTGRRQSAALADELAGSRIAHVYASSMAPAVQTAEIVAGRLGVAMTVREGLGELSVGEQESEVVARMSEVLEEVADGHRGEAVLVVSHRGAICSALPHLAWGDQDLDGQAAF